MGARPRSRRSWESLEKSLSRTPKTGAATPALPQVPAAEADGDGAVQGARVEIAPPPPASQDRLLLHLRRYMPFYAMAAIFALMMVVLPSRGPGGEEATQLGADVPGAVDGTTYGGPVDDGTTSGGGTASGGGAAVGGPAQGAVGGQVKGAIGPVKKVATPPRDLGDKSTVTKELLAFDPLAWKAKGKTRGGFDCGPGVRQLPWSRYAAPCLPKWTGTNNGGATARGVFKDKIVIVRRDFPDSAASQAVDAFVQQAGFASADEFDEARHKFVDYFNKTFELFGRKVELVEYLSEYGDSTQEAFGAGKEGACQDADSINAKYKPLLILSASAPFGECEAARKTTVIGAGAYYPEWWYRKYHPYIWAGVMECERIAHQNAEYVGKRLLKYKSRWAKLAQKNLPRKLGLYVPTNDEYQSCVKIANDDLKKKYGLKDKISQYNYQLDVARLADQAALAVPQWVKDGVTTVLLACDPLSPIFLTQNASNAGFFPEWVTNGAGLTDVEQFARLWDQPQIQGSLFGMSQLGDTGRILGPKGEGTATYKKATGNTIPPGTQTEYYAMLGLFSILQATGPVLTPLSLAATYWRLPPGGAPEFEVGYSSYRDGPDGQKGGHDHTAVDDNREIYWVCTNYSGDPGGTSRCNAPKSYDGKGGTYRTTYGGKRFRNNEWPAEEPPIYPVNGTTE